MGLLHSLGRTTVKHWIHGSWGGGGGIEAMIIALDGARDHIELRMQWSGREKPTLYLLGHVFLVVLTDWSCHIFRCHR